MSDNNKPILWYFADPMCSWCWGFSPVIEQVRVQFADQLKIALNLGGLRPGTTHTITQNERDEILHYWHAVQQMTGAEFKFENAMPEGFIYDTEPASRLVTLVAAIDPELVFKCFHNIQAAFYRDGEDVTSKTTLKKIAGNLGVSENQFNDLFDSANIKQNTQQHFEGTYQAAIRGFPAIVWQDINNTEKLCSGYVPFEKLSNQIENKLKNSAKQRV